MNFCKHKEIFGKEKTGAHSYRFFDVAVVDVLLTFIFAYLIAIFSGNNFYKVFVILFLLGIILHRIFCVRTTIDKLLF